MENRTTELATDTLLIGEAAECTGVNADTLRYYERLGLLEEAPRSSAGYRLYGPEAVQRVTFIKKAQTLGLTLAEIGDVIQVAHDEVSPCEHVREVLRARIEELDAKMRELRGLRRTLVGALEREPATSPPEGCVCSIIEAERLPRPDGAGRPTADA